jgi:hypothetical protein
MTIIPDIYDRIGSILWEICPNLGMGGTFTTGEVYKLYVQRYPADEEFMRQRQIDKPTACSLKGYLNGMVYEYYKKAGGSDSDQPAIEFLGKMTYRFV